MKKVLLFKLLVLGALIVTGCNNKHSGDSSEYGLIGDDNTTSIVLNGQGDNGNKNSNSTVNDDGTKGGDTNGTGGNGDTNGNSDDNATSGDNNDTNGNGGKGIGVRW